MTNNINFFKWNKLLLFINIGLIVLFGIIFFYHIEIVSKTVLPPRFSKVLKEYGDYYITKITLCKQEVSMFVRKVFDIVSQGKMRDKYKQLGKARHPYLILTVVNNKENPTIEKKLLLEKKEITVLRPISDKEFQKKTDKNNQDLETTCFGDINGIPSLTVKEFVTNTLEQMKEEFFVYKCKDKQCGYFLEQSIIKTNFVPESEQKLVLDFLELDKYNQLLKDYPKTQKIVNTLSNILAYREYLLHSDDNE